MRTKQGSVDKGEYGHTFDKTTSESTSTSISPLLLHANTRRAIDTSPYHTPHPNSHGAAIVLLYRSPEIGLEQIPVVGGCSIANRYYVTVVYIRVLVDD